MAVSWRPDQLDPPRPVSAPVERANRNQTVQSSRRRKRTQDRAGVSRGMIGGTMANTAKCAAPEGNRGRDEWMTVLEMQEYMGRAGARRTTSSGRERSTRTGSEGSSWCRGRQWTPTSSRGVAGDDGGDRPGSRRAGHARKPRDERSSRTTMTKSISRSQVRLIASVLWFTRGS